MFDQALSHVAAEIAAGTGLSMGTIARRIGVSPATASRWVSRGLPDRRGGRCRLEAIRRGRVFFTSEAALARFFDGLRTNDAPKLPSVTAGVTGVSARASDAMQLLASIKALSAIRCVIASVSASALMA